MSQDEHLQIDLADPEDIRRKLPDARKLYAQKRRELEDLARQVQQWGDLISVLGRVVGEDVEVGKPVSISAGARVRTSGYASPSGKRAPAQDQAVAALEAIGHPTGPTELYRFMRDHDMNVPKNANALGAALWGAEKKGRVKRATNGLYAPLTWEPEQEFALHVGETALERGGFRFERSDDEREPPAGPISNPEAQAEEQ
jgi:hypothetical protein